MHTVRIHPALVVDCFNVPGVKMGRYSPLVDDYSQALYNVKKSMLSSDVRLIFVFDRWLSMISDWP